MRIRNQEKIMSAVAAVLNAENAVNAFVTEPKRKRSNKDIAKRNALMTDAQVNLTHARAELRKAHTEILHEEYGG